MDEAERKGEETGVLRQAVRVARIEAAERSAMVVDLRDAEAARLEIVNEAIEPVFRDIPAEHADVFDRGVSGGQNPRLWIDMVTHVAMARDRRTYRLLNDTLHGRRVLAESAEVSVIADAITSYVARRLVAREQMLATVQERPRRRRGPVIGGFILGVLFGAGALALILAALMPR
jgi:hypothetical protein